MTEEKSIFMFPGQGAQSIGMGADLARDFKVAKAVFEEVDETLHQNLSSLMFEGDLAQLTQTQNAQPAIMAVSMAVVRVLESEGYALQDHALAVAGHSLGEYSALCAAGAITLPQAALLLQARGQAMAEACEANQGGMLALLGATPEQAYEIAEKCGCYVANDNSVGQIVLSGVQEALYKAKVCATEMGIKRALPLQVAGAFHSPLMQEAAEKMRCVLDETKFSVPKVPVYFNVTAKTESDVGCFSDLMVQQIVSPVRWRELILNTKASSFIECGSGNVLCGLIKRIVPDAQTVALNSSETIQSFLK